MPSIGFWFFHQKYYNKNIVIQTIINRYKCMLETKINPCFEHYKLNKIKPTDIMRFYDLLEEDAQIVRRKNKNGKKTKNRLS